MTRALTGRLLASLALLVWGCDEGSSSDPSDARAASFDSGTRDRDAEPVGDARDVGPATFDASMMRDDGGPPRPPDPRANPRLADLPDNTALHLGQYECASRLPQIADYCQSIFDYSRFNYDPYNHRLLLFGGGHSATGRTDVDVFDLDTLTWNSLYPSMSCEEVRASDIDPRGFHRATGHPAARHTYDQNVIVDLDGVPRLLMLSNEGFAGTCHRVNVPMRAIPSLALTPENTTWTYGPLHENGFPWHYSGSAEFDPPSGMVIAIGQGRGASSGGMWVIDPRTLQASAFVGTVRYGQIDHNLLFYPPTETMYLINREDRGDGLVMEIVLDRSDWSRSRNLVVETTGEAPTVGSTTGYAYDSHNRVIGGGVSDGRFFTFDPTTSRWSSQEMNVISEGGVRPDRVYFHNLDYDPVNNVFYFITGTHRGYQMWAYRYRS